MEEKSMQSLQILIPQPTSTSQNSYKWRLFHCINYLIGGITFFFGSIMYFPKVDSKFDNKGYEIGGYLFTLGSFTFLLADTTEWLHFKSQAQSQTQEKNNLFQKLKKQELQINFFVSCIGSLLYLIGSIFFIPETNQLTLGEWAFIIGSLIIFLSQGWKMARTLMSQEKINRDDESGFYVDLFAGLGGLAYFFGTIFFVYADVHEKILIFACVLFTAGGLFFSLSGFNIIYRYFYLKNRFEVSNIFLQNSQ